jgi:hypothetical protein
VGAGIFDMKGGTKLGAGNREHTGPAPRVKRWKRRSPNAWTRL